MINSIQNFTFSSLFIRDSKQYEDRIELLFIDKTNLSSYIFFDGIEIKFVQNNLNSDLNSFDEINSHLISALGEQMQITSIEEDEWFHFKIIINDAIELKIFIALDFKEDIVQQISFTKLNPS